MTQEPTPQNEPYYVVITGTNIRSTLPGKDYTPKVYDSAQIAQDAISADNERLKLRGVMIITPRSPISVDVYDQKYSAYRNIPKE
jgi:hypothetical protein